MSPTAQILLTSPTTEVSFNWSGYDGDDCFDDFHINVSSQSDNRRFDFGPCAVNALRKLRRFFSDSSRSEVGGGFRNPDIRYYDMYRSGDNFQLVIRFEGSGLHEEFVVHSPIVHIPEEFNDA